MTRLPARLRAMLSLDRLGGQAIAVFALKGIGAVASFAISWLIAHHFGARGSGLFGIAVTTTTFLAMLLLFGLDTQLLRLVAGDLKVGDRRAADAAVRTVTRLLLVAAPLVVLLLWLLRTPLATRLLDQPDVAPLLAIMLWAALPLTLVKLASVVLRAHGHVFASQLVDGPLGTGLAAVALAAALTLGLIAGLTQVGWFYLAALTVGAVTGWLLLRRRAPRAAPALPLLPLAPLLLAGLPVLMSALANIFTEWFTTVSLGAHWPAGEVGIYRVAWQFVAVAGLVQVAMDAILGPRIAAAARVGDMAEIAATARKGSLAMLLLSAPLFLAFFAAPGLLMRLFGPEFVAGATALQVLALGQLVRLAAGPLGTIIIMTGNQRWIIAYAALGVALCIGTCALLIPGYGAVGAAWAATITVVVRHLGAFLIVERVIGVKLFRKGPA
ncbi:lipopolysaccharide biosynthesis protein [Sandaracinobacteroides saxicola]|uniref:Oligosaccharide flippase family protein n=1 Tax=Sandaracinobacteroides saxicola TaxID=2759707 RepID=A0A7G5IFD0_9SPHN|nr:oligosaccharide flippase family protein [Sandaracinobacteroides saxicola]QMW22072.1 oligosaccharide flippase family protein [Sandaracinobacteroides saxicola]